MSQLEAQAQTLHAYHDGELGWWARRRFERQLARSAELRAELESLRALTEWTADSAADVALPAGAIWEGIEGRLRAVDAAVEAGGAAASPGAAGASAFAGWRPLGAAAFAAAGVLVLFLALRPTPGVPEPIASGAVRYLDAGERSVMVQEHDDVTIIWVMGGAEDV